MPIVQPLAVTTGSAQSLSPGRAVVTMGDSLSEPGYLDLMWNKVCAAFAGPNLRLYVPFLGHVLNQSPPTVSLLKMFLDPRKGQRWGGGSSGDCVP